VPETTLEARQTGENFVLLRSGAPQRRVGVYARGSCDLKLLYACAPFIRPALKGTCCILSEGGAADARSDVLLQTLQSFPGEWLDSVRERLGLDDDYFRPVLFEKTFTVPGRDGPEEFPKTVVCLSLGPDLMRTVYRHREYGLLVDPGGAWLNQSLELVLRDLSVATWFRDNFVSVGKLSVDEFVQHFSRVVRLVQSETGAHVMVFNTLTVDPGSLLHCYQLVKNCHAIRRRQFHLALVDLSRELGFSVIDLDRVLKRAGVHIQVDFGHPPPVFNPLIAQEVVRILREREVL
jgi:hypothetical protein